MKKSLVLCLILPLLTSCGVKDFDIHEKPQDFNFDYWLFDEVDIDKIDHSRIYDDYMTSVRYLDSKYDFTDDGYPETRLPKENIQYQFLLNSEKWIVSGIYITDPSVFVYGLSMNSSNWKIKRFFKKRGFTYVDGLSGMNPYYCLDGVANFRVYSEFIQIEAIVK